VGLARALYLESRILILDEATSALDAETENAIAKNLEFLKGKKTVIVIAHREATLAMATRVLKFVGGKITELNRWTPQKHEDPRQDN
jgi:ABC-type bacteriocin/lantibiotic exporter with double-glycine peptidase domain